MAPHAELYQNGSVPGDGVSSLQRKCPAKHHGVRNKSRLIRYSDEETLDLICVGFGPSNLALAVALHDQLERSSISPSNQSMPRVLFLERNLEYSWHSGMQMPSAHMQITFLKDLATLRNPRSEFTFINYLHRKGRLVDFTNLGTFLPERVEYEDYMRWCAGWFDDVVEYGQEVTRIQLSSNISPAKEFHIEARDIQTGNLKNYSARNVVVAIGGKPQIPQALPQSHPLVLHSSMYATRIEKALPNKSGLYHIAVIGGGQSSAEIFNDLHSRYPNARTTLIVRGSSLRPSDDSPFVNEIFHPTQVDGFFGKSDGHRAASLVEDRPTNYSVVRLDLLEHLYAKMYRQRVFEPDETKWQHRILTNTTVIEAEPTGSSLQILTQHMRDSDASEVILNADAIIAGTGYRRDGHVPLMQPLKSLNPHQSGAWSIGRDYKVHLRSGAVAENAGIYLQGCNEATHGLSDTLLSILASRAGEVVESIFGPSM